MGVKPVLRETQLRNQDLRLGASWVLMVLLNLSERRPIFTSKWTTAWHHGVRCLIEHPFVGKYVSASMCGQVCVGKDGSVRMGQQGCVGEDVLARMCWQVCVSKAVSARMCRQSCVGKDVLASICWQGCVGKCVSASMCWFNLELSATPPGFVQS